MSSGTGPANASPKKLPISWHWFLQKLKSTRFQQLLEDKGVTVTEWVALRTLWSQDEATHAELILALGVTKGAASKVVSRLEQKGLAGRQLAEGRAREQYLALTAAGKALVPKLAALADANDTHFFGHLPAAKRLALTQAMQYLVQHHQLKEIPTELL